MRIVCIILIIVSGLYSCSREMIITETQIGDDLLYVADKLSPFTGKCKVVYCNSELTKEILKFKKGRLEGVAVYYYKNGNVKWKGAYKNGYISGRWEFWSEDGEKMYETYYQNDTLDGEFKSWYPTGTVKEEGSYLKNRKTGTWQFYQEDGTISDTQKY